MSATAAPINPKAIPGRAKPQIHAVPFGPLLEIGAVNAGGAAKYGLLNWRDDRIHLSDYIDAIFRHLSAVADGQDNDPESGKRHLAHIAATCIIVMDAMDHGTMVDDRWKPKPAAAP